MEQYMF